MTGFEPATSCSQNRRTTKLCYTPLRRLTDGIVSIIRLPFSFKWQIQVRHIRFSRLDPCDWIKALLRHRFLRCGSLRSLNCDRYRDVAGEPTTSCSQNRRTTKLCYTPLRRLTDGIVSIIRLPFSFKWQIQVRHIRFSRLDPCDWIKALLRHRFLRCGSLRSLNCDRYRDVAGEPATSCSQNRRTTKLCHTPLRRKPARAVSLPLPLFSSANFTEWRQ